MDKPIIFNTEMVKATFNDFKNQTRRLNGLKEINKDPEFWELVDVFDNMYSFRFDDKLGYHPDNYIERLNIKCPWYVGQKLWVRETWAEAFNPTKNNNGIIYKADYGHRIDLVEDLSQWKWKPSIYMSKKYVRLWLEITDVRVERLQDISYGDAVSEGLYKEWDGSKHWYAISENEDMSPYPQLVFRKLWDSLNEKRGYGWNLNPYCWCISFKKIDK